MQSQVITINKETAMLSNTSEGSIYTKNFSVVASSSETANIMYTINLNTQNNTFTDLTYEIVNIGENEICQLEHINLLHQVEEL